MLRLRLAQKIKHSTKLSLALATRNQLRQRGGKQFRFLAALGLVVPPPVSTKRSGVVLSAAWQADPERFAAEPMPALFVQPTVPIGELPAARTQDASSRTESAVRSVEGQQAIAPSQAAEHSPDAHSRALIEEQPRQVMAEQRELDAESSIPKEVPPSAAGTLFEPRAGQRRSPQDWAAKLLQAEKMKEGGTTPLRLPLVPDSADAAPVRRPTIFVPSVAVNAEPMPQAFVNAPSVATEKDPVELISSSARRFLQPLLGIDLSGVPLRRGTQAQQATAENRAEAMTDGEEILLGAGHRVEAPETLGVIAHELTHVVRRQQPRFVPPVVRDLQQRGAATPVPAEMEEEPLARLVESHVLAQAKKGRVAGNEVSQPERHESGKWSAANWGALPAPWEPLPEWVGAAPAAVHQPENALMTEQTFLPANTVAPMPIGSGNETGSMQLAEEGRSLMNASGVIAENSDKPAVSPDLDALARQVYTLLKRRLAAERRREMFR